MGTIPVYLDTVIFRVKCKDNSNVNTVDKVGLQILLAKGKDDTMWHLPFVELDTKDTYDTALSRVFETPDVMKIANIEKADTLIPDISNVKVDNIVRIVLLGSISNTTELVLKDCEYQWFWAASFKDPYFRSEDDTIAFDDLGHGHMNDYVVTEFGLMKNSLKYAFNMVDEEFTITELEEAYNVISKSPIPSFRRMIKNSIVPTDNFREGKHFRPSRLYRRVRHEH